MHNADCGWMAQLTFLLLAFPTTQTTAISIVLCMFSRRTCTLTSRNKRCIEHKPRRILHGVGRSHCDWYRVVRAEAQCPTANLTRREAREALGSWSYGARVTMCFYDFFSDAEQ
ncbi:membrane-associated protein, putative [Bodo saltans]|uniref:Membrane-associated protein, putative n=1 Tax=Bodo saltans TaxID=75058 RepID=A0A0S4JA16_BODSA|nr:membrane-associated protein, putative [Bodo saltans]|eukprot:CUG88294.1 membrane-associated protein, putative [Bodo saltans]